jgi:general secretion pathway protein G
MRRGFTLIEILIVITIIAILGIFISNSFTNNRIKAENSRIKSDLYRLKIAFEDYYNDHNCYPPAAWFDKADDCGSAQLTPYLAQIPCDPHTGMPYKLETDSNNPPGCIWFKLYGSLTSPTLDEDALAQYSDSGSSLGNYGVSSSNTSVAVFFDTSTPTPNPSSTPQPSPSPTGNPSDSYSYCYNSANHDCNSFDPNLESCTPYFVNDDYCGGCLVNGTCTPL